MISIGGKQVSQAMRIRFRFCTPKPFSSAFND